MGKFTDGLEKWVQERDKRQKKRRQDASAVEFLAVKKDVTEAIEAGYSLKTIWEYLKKGEKVRSTYETFRRHVKRFIKDVKRHIPDQAKPADPGKGGSKPGSKAAAKAPCEPKKSEAPPLRGFTFNPSPKKEDLI